VIHLALIPLFVLQVGDAPNAPGAAPSEPAPVDEATPSDATPSDATPSDATPSDAATSDATPSDATPSDATPSDTTPSDAAPSDAAPSEAIPPVDATTPTFTDALDVCLQHIDASSFDDARLCLDALSQNHPEHQAEIDRVRRVLDATAPKSAPVVEEPPIEASPAPPRDDSPLPAFLSPGRLELAAVSGIYGVWAGVTAGLFLGFNSDQYLWNIDPSLIILTTGGAGVGLGLAALAGGYVVADALDIDQGNAWAYTAGMTWGTSFAISALPVFYDAGVVPWWLTDEVNAGLPLLGGGIGAATAFGLSLVVDPELPEVSMMNTGGWTAGAAGLLVGLNAVLWSEQASHQPTTVALTYVAGKTVGLGLGLLASQFIDYTWGETLLGDVGVVLGALLFGSGAFAFVASPFSEPTLEALIGHRDEALFGKLTLTFVSGAAIGGGMLGLAATTAGLYVFHRYAGVRFLREDLPFEIVPMTLGVVVDRTGNAAPAVSFLHLVF